MSDTKKCISCGADLDAKASFCPTCGTKQEDIKITKIQRKPKPKVKAPLDDKVIKDLEQKAVQTVPSSKKIEKPVPPKKEVPVDLTPMIRMNEPEETPIKKEPTKEDTSKIQKKEIAKKEEKVEKKIIPPVEKPIVKEQPKKEPEIPDEIILENNEDLLIEDPLILGFSTDMEIIEAPIPEEKKEETTSKVKADKLTPKIELTGQDLKKYAQKKLKEISIDEKMEMTLFPIIGHGTRGFRCTFLGATGTSKELKFEEIAQLLYEIGKLDTPEIELIGFSEIPKEWNTRKIYVIDDLQSAISTLFNLEDFSENASDMQKHFQDLMNQLINAPRNAYIFLTSKPAEYRGFVPLDPRLTFVFDKKVQFPDLTKEEIFTIFKSLIPDTHISQINKKFKEYFLGYIDRNRRFFPFENSELASFLADYAVREDEVHLPAEKYNPAGLDETLSKIIGMENVKEQVKELNQYLSVSKNLEKAGAHLPEFNMHMMFLGNPGVGKTSIARVISKILFDLGYCREEKLVEVTSKDLVGAYGNQTGIKTNRVIMRALGGVLFIDEAYSLSNSCGQAGAEAIAIIIKAMMDYKNDLVVMFAGYNLEMRSFVESNSGISSRINYIFKFEDYSPEELYDIFLLKLGFIGMDIDPEAVLPVQKLCKFASGRKNAGNGRFVENLIQKAITKHALLNLPQDKIMTLTKQSIPTVEDIMKTIF